MGTATLERALGYGVLLMALLRALHAWLLLQPPATQEHQSAVSDASHDFIRSSSAVAWSGWTGAGSWERDLWNALAHAASQSAELSTDGQADARWDAHFREIHCNAAPADYGWRLNPGTARGRYFLREEWRAFARQAPGRCGSWRRSAPTAADTHDIEALGADPFRGDGIVMAIGHPSRYLVPALVTIRLLRQLGCILPLEIWYSSRRGESPAAAGVVAEIQRANAAAVVVAASTNSDTAPPLYFRDLDDVVPELDASRLPRSLFAIKPLAVLYSRFRRVMYLDADAHPLRDPTDLFEALSASADAPGAGGALFWPDYWLTEPTNPAFSIFDIVPGEMPTRRQQESSVLLVDKGDCSSGTWAPLLLSVMLNLRWTSTYQYVHGDKDTFRLAWLALQRPFRMVPTLPAAAGYVGASGDFYGTTMVQHDLAGGPLFLHCNLEKIGGCVDRQRGDRRWQRVQHGGGTVSWTTGGRWTGPESRIVLIGPEVQNTSFVEYVGQDYETRLLRPVLHTVLSSATVRRAGKAGGGGGCASGQRRLRLGTV